MSVEKIERILVDMVCAGGGDIETIRKRARQIAKIAAPTDPLLAALYKIACYPSGGVIMEGAAAGDWHAMIHIARQALIEFHGVGSWLGVLRKLGK